MVTRCKLTACALVEIQKGLPKVLSQYAIRTELYFWERVLRKSRAEKLEILSLAMHERSKLELARTIRQSPRSASIAKRYGINTRKYENILQEMCIDVKIDTTGERNYVAYPILLFSLFHFSSRYVRTSLKSCTNR